MNTLETTRQQSLGTNVPDAPFFSNPESPSTYRSPKRRDDRSVKSIFGGLRDIAVASVELPGRFLRYGGNVWRRRSLSRCFADAQLALGERMYAAGIDDGESGLRIAFLDQKIAWAKTAGAPLDGLRREREKLLRTLADHALEEDAPLPGADVEYAVAKRAQEALTCEGTAQ